MLRVVLRNPGITFEGFRILVTAVLQNESNYRDITKKNFFKYI